VSTHDTLMSPRRADAHVRQDVGRVSSAELAAANPSFLAAVVEQGTRTPGVELPPVLRAAFASRFGLDLDGVRMHQSPEAAGAAALLDARAFTFGRDIVLGPDGDNADTLRHELVHAAQFSRSPTPSRPHGLASGSHAAHAEAASPTAGVAPTASPGGLVQRQQTTELQKKEEPKVKEDQPVTQEGAFISEIERSETGRKVYSWLPPGVKMMVQGENLQQGFMATFVPAVLASVTDADKQQLNEQFSSPLSSTAFNVGVYAGLHVGVVKDLGSNLVGLWELAKLAVEYSIPGLTYKLIKEAQEYGADPEAYKKKKYAEAVYAGQVAASVWEFFQRVDSDPAALIGTGETFGLAAADYASHWFHDEFLKKSPFMQGETIGEGIGMVATEVALLFLGPEEWIARGIVAAGQSARVAAKGTRLGKYIIELLEKAPEIARIFKARKEFEAAKDALEASRKLKQAEQAAAEARKLEKAVGVAGDVHPHGPVDVPHKVPEVKTPEIKPDVKPELKPEVKPEVKPDVKPEVKTDVKPDVPTKKTEPVKDPLKKPADKPPVGDKVPAKKEPAPKKKTTPKEKEPAKAATTKEPPAKPKEKPEPKKSAGKKEPSPTKDKAPKKDPAPTKEPKPKKEPTPQKSKASKKPSGAAKDPPPKTPKEKAPSKKLSPAEAAARKARQAEARKALEEIRKKPVKRGGFGEGWDYKRFPEGPGGKWKPGDPPDMPSADGRHPGWDTIRTRIWKNLAHNELQARKAGVLRDTEKLLDMNPATSLTNKELEKMLKSGQGRAGYEIEHARIPQRVADMLEKSGLPKNEARKLAHLGDPSNLDPGPKEWHAIVDEVANSWKHRNPTLPASIDDRLGQPLQSMHNEEVKDLIDALNKNKIDLGATPEGRRLRDLLKSLKADRGHSAQWVIP
jgi:hypothetical protein